MPIFQTPLVKLMNERLQYLSQRSKVITENIVRADVIGAKRKELIPFKELIDKRKYHHKTDVLVYDLSIGAQDVKELNQGIEKEMEVLEMNHNVLNQQAIVDILNTARRLLKAALNKR